MIHQRACKQALSNTSTAWGGGCCVTPCCALAACQSVSVSRYTQSPHECAACLPVYLMNACKRGSNKGGLVWSHFPTDSVEILLQVGLYLVFSCLSCCIRVYTIILTMYSEPIIIIYSCQPVQSLLPFRNSELTVQGIVVCTYSSLLHAYCVSLHTFLIILTCT
jgi:hypothetical protein